MKILKGIVFCALVVCASVLRAAEGGEVLWWMISDIGSVEGTSEDGSIYTAKELGVTDARVRYQGEDGSTGYLPLMGVLSDGTVETYEGALGVGLPGSYFASLGDFSGASYSFVLELGNWADGAWVGTSMESAAASYAELKGDRHIAEWHDTTPIYSQPWMPTSFSVVPEPSGGLLMLFGTAFLALRRRKRGVTS